MTQSSQSFTIRRIGDTKDRLGESPVWDEAAQRLYWVDAFTGTIHGLNTFNGEREDFSVPAPIGSMVLSRNGCILALKDGFYRYDFNGACTPLAMLGISHPNLRLNDGKADANGCFIAGTMHSGRAEDEAPLGGLYRLRPNGQLELLDTDFALTNGPCFSPDGHSLYVADSLRRVIWAYDYASDGPLRNKRVFLRTEAFDSGADGCLVDAEGFLWSVLVRAGKIARFDPSGRLERLIEMPVTYPTSLAFGGPNLNVLYVTSISASHNLTAPEPEAGGLFAIEGLGVRGLPAHRFSGA
ncbi:SMP-30/gluconolactonase/LRE family protein [Ferrovibrio sp.]|uniref:SMP-30/gluconolactonase/LRE family protein n=1 Tax=Ferrovibrio sp. TaxID=1917215 RepID=UPI0035B29869